MTQVQETSKAYKATSKKRKEWREQRIAEIVTCAEVIDNVNLVRLLDFARVFAKKQATSAQELLPKTVTEGVKQ